MSGMAVRLHQGVYSGSVGLFGAGIVILLPSAKIVGWLLIAAAVSLALWGIKIGDRHWWDRAPENGGVPVPEGPSPASGPSQIEKLIVRRDSLEQLIDNAPTEAINDAIQGYKTAIRTWSAQERVKPAQVPRDLSHSVWWVQMSFQRLAREFAVELPKPELPQLDDADSAGRPPMYRPSQNQDFLDGHKRNLAAFERARNEVYRKLADMRNEVGRLRADIEVERERA